MKKKFHPMLLLLLLLFFFSEIKSSYDKFANDIQSLFVPLENIDKILEFFGKNMDDKVNDILSQGAFETQKQGYNSPLNDFLSNYVVNKDFFGDYGEEDCRYSRRKYTILKKRITKQLSLGKISFLGLNNILYNEHITNGQLYVTRTGILKCDDKYFLMQRANMLLSENTYPKPVQHFTFMEIEECEPFFFFDRNGQMYIKNARDMKEYDQYVPVTLEYNTVGAFERKDPVKLYDLTVNGMLENEFVSVASRDMFIGIANVLLHSYINLTPNTISRLLFQEMQQPLGIHDFQEDLDGNIHYHSTLLFQQMQKNLGIHYDQENTNSLYQLDNGQNILNHPYIQNFQMYCSEYGNLGTTTQDELDQYILAFDTDTHEYAQQYDVYCPEKGHFKCTFEKESPYRDEVVVCNKCQNVIDEFFHCDQCINYDICLDCVEQIAGKTK